MFPANTMAYDRGGGRGKLGMFCSGLLRCCSDSMRLDPPVFRRQRIQVLLRRLPGATDEAMMAPPPRRPTNPSAHSRSGRGTSAQWCDNLGEGGGARHWGLRLCRGRGRRGMATRGSLPRRKKKCSDACRLGWEDGDKVTRSRR
jgi:hypothetical protein